jgi:hypothetical protein
LSNEPAPPADLEEVRKVLGVTSTEDLQSILLFLYVADTEVNHLVNRKLVRAYMDRQTGRKSLPMVPPHHSEYSWFKADEFCKKCPGSELHEYGPGLFLPKCMNFGRPDKYATCIKYRENMDKAEQHLKDQYANEKLTDLIL